MQVLINGETHTLEAAVELAEFLQKLGYRGETFAVALNGGFVARSEYINIQVQNGDSLEIVAPVVGG